MTFDVIVSDFGYTKEVYFVSNVPRIAIFCGQRAISHFMALFWPRGQMLLFHYLLYIKLIILRIMVLSGTRSNSTIFSF